MVAHNSYPSLHLKREPVGQTYVTNTALYQGKEHKKNKVADKAHTEDEPIIIKKEKERFLIYIRTGLKMP